MARILGGAEDQREDEDAKSAGQASRGLARVVAAGVAAVGVVAAGTAAAQEAKPAVKAAPAPGAAQGRLIDQARYWSKNGRQDLAVQSLQRLLKAEPENADGLYEMARILMVQGDAAGAQAYADRLRKLVGSGGLSERLRKEFEIATLDNKALQQARKLAAQGEYATALQIYDRALAGRTLVGDLALEYYQTMAGVEPRWADARAGLARLLAAAPKDLGVRLALARIETYRAETRRGAIATLLELAKTESEREAALDAARDGLKWLEAGKQDQPLFAAYARFRPDDDLAAAALARAENPTPADLAAAARTRGFSLLEEGRLEEAEDEFADLIAKDARDLEALLGLGIVRSRQEAYAEAVDLLRRAVRLDEGEREDFRRALAAAEFGRNIQAVRRAVEAGDRFTAEALLAKMTPETADERAQAAGVHAQIALAAKDLPAAERRFREALDAQPKDDAALAGLLNVLMQQNATDRLQAALSRYAGAAKDGEAGAALAKARGFLAAQRGDTRLAIEQYGAALAAAPDDPWARLSAARALRDGGRLAEARALFDGADRSKDAELIHAAALYAFETRDWARTEALLALTPPELRSAEMTRLAAHARVQIGVDRSLLAASVGDPAEARRSLLTLYTPGVTSPDEAMLIGSALLEVGDGRTAASLVRQGVQARGDATVAQLSDAAKLLVAAGDHDGAAAVLETLQQRLWDMTDTERLALSAVHDDLMVARARGALEARDLARALDFVGPVYDANPTHRGALRTLGEINGRAGRREEGLQFYMQALQLDPGDTDALRGAVGALTQMRRYKDAHRLIDDALVRAPGAADLHLLKADVYKADGELRQALAAMEDAQRARRPGTARMSLAQGDANPFRQALARDLPPSDLQDPNTPQTPPARPVMGAEAAPRPLESPRTPRPSPAAERRAREAQAAVQLLRAASDALPRIEPLGAYQAPSLEGIDARTPLAPLVDEPPALQFVQMRTPLETEYRPVAERSARTVTFAAGPEGGSVRDRLEALGAPGEAGSAESASGTRDLAWEAADLRTQLGFSATEQFGFRWREGEQGLSQLTEFELPLTLGFGLGGGRLSATARPVFLSAGDLGTDSLKLRRFGAFAAVAPARRTGEVTDDAGGVGLGLSYAHSGLSVDIGSTPLGFETPNVVGGIAFSVGLGERFRLEASAARRPVTDSVLSYAGVVDPVTGDTFGGVIDNRLRLGGSVTVGAATFYAAGAGIVREGENVDSNTGAQLDTGLSLRLGETLASGFNLTYLGFEENLRHFTLGHGGYFSPQAFVSATVPLNYTYSSPRLEVEFKNALGVQYYDEDGAALFPDRSDLAALALSVAAAEALTAPPQSKLILGYEAESRTNLAARSSVITTYRLTPSLRLRAGLSVDRAADWTEAIGFVGLTVAPGGSDLR